MTSQRDRLIGSWRLFDWRIDYGDGRAATYPFGRDVTGLLVYAPDGYMHGCIAHAVRPTLDAASAKHAPAAERLAAFDSFFSYGGSWSVEGDVVTHVVTIALNQNLVGTRQPRRMTFAGDTLTLEAQDLLPGTEVTRNHALAWRRLPAHLTDRL
jgi:hypothetical protein